MTRPQSSTATYRRILTCPVSGSTSTTQAWVPKGNTKLEGSQLACPSSPGSIPSGRFHAR
jgi:hypothetical protein